jgi:hypothetical protein
MKQYVVEMVVRSNGEIDIEVGAFGDLKGKEPARMTPQEARAMARELQDAANMVERLEAEMCRSR